MDTPTKTGIDAGETASKRVVQKAAEVMRDFIGNKIAEKITSAAISEEDDKAKKVEEI